MKIHCITGSWREAYRIPKIEQDVRADIRDIFNRGDAIVTGGAPGVDFYATDEIMQLDPSAARVTVILPIPLEKMIAHFRRRMSERVILPAHRIEENIALLKKIARARPGAVQDAGFDAANKDSYYARHNLILNQTTGDVYAYQIEGSGGTEDTIAKARAGGIRVHLKMYTLSA